MCSVSQTRIILVLTSVAIASTLALQIERLTSVGLLIWYYIDMQVLLNVAVSPTVKTVKVGKYVAW